MSRLRMKNKCVLWSAMIMLLLLGTGRSVFAQDAVSDFKKLNEVMADRKFRMTMVYELYPDYESSKSMEKKNIYVSMWDDQVRMNAGEMDVIRNDKYCLYVNNRIKTMILQPGMSGKWKKEVALLQQWISIDSIFKRYSRVQMLEKNNLRRTYRLFYNPGESRYAWLDVTLNSQTFVLEKVKVYFAKSLGEMMRPGSHRKDPQTEKPPRLEITYKDFVFMKEKDANDFSLSPYLVFSGTGKSLTSKYATYEFSDHTTPQQKKRSK